MKEVVIKIPDLVYESIIVGAETSRDEADVLFAIRQGTVLPKGHGDLIDRSKLVYYRCPNNVKDCPPSYDFKCNSCDYGITHKFRVDREEAVIPADKENKE